MIFALSPVDYSGNATAALQSRAPALTLHRLAALAAQYAHRWTWSPEPAARDRLAGAGQLRAELYV